jgi:hypothetical protein
MSNKIDGMSMDLEQDERNKLQSLFPQCQPIAKVAKQEAKKPRE